MQENKVQIDVSKIPDAVANRLARETLASVKYFIEQPGGKELLDAKIAEFHKKTGGVFYVERLSEK